MRSIKFLIELLFMFLFALPICIILLLIIEIAFIPQTLKTLKKWTKDKLKSKRLNLLLRFSATAECKKALKDRTRD